MTSRLFLVLICSLQMLSSYAWGPEGHAIVGRLALEFVQPDVRKNVLRVLDAMPIDTAANWMDIMKSNSDYEFMRSWHYVDFAKGASFQPSIDDNLMNRLMLTYRELQHKDVLPPEQVRFDLLVLLHLMGDLTMPLHTGYEDDLGGNRRMVQYDTLKTHNLHWFWDEDVIRLNGIRYDDCLAMYKSNPGNYDTIKAVDFTAWMMDSRQWLGQVYDLKDGYMVTDPYLQDAGKLVKQQLLLGGLRLAVVLNKLFYAPSAPVDFKALTDEAKKGIDIQDALKYIGKTVTVCEHVYGVRQTPTITQINLGAKYPNNPLTVVIFGKNYVKFPAATNDLYKDKNICVIGKIELYQGKPQIIVERPEDITVY